MKPIYLALLSGLCLALGWPTYGFPLFLFFAFVPLLWAEFKLRQQLNKTTAAKVFGLSYLTFFLWNIITTYWLYHSTVFGMVFAVLVNSLLMSLVFLIYHHLAKRLNFSAGATFLICLWIGFEKLHLIWEFSWPWLNLGNGFSEYITWIQWYEYTGTFGGTLWVWLLNFSIFKSLLLYRQYREKAIIYRGIIKNTLFILLPIVVSLLLWNAYAEKDASPPQLEAVIVQPNINPYTEKYNTTDKRVGQLINSLAKEKLTDSTAILVAPETVYADGTQLNQFKYSQAHYFAEELLTQYPNLNILAGISMMQWITQESKVRGQTNFVKPGLWYDDYNSAFLMRKNAEPQLYHKSKLVVGVENFPYQEFLKPILGDVMIDLGGTVAMKTTQDKREVFSLNGKGKAAPIICYESVYGEYVTGYSQNEAGFLSIITNDAWWGNTQGHKQHLSYARLRAIENRKDVVRSANTGISAFINQRGEITQQLGYEKQGALRGKVNLNTQKTFYVKYGDYIARIAIFLGVFVLLFGIAKKRKLG
ncbi:apolipoprotein N-acyltransferase [Haloflavibacter putidus]|uniref:Apolipoprotein N-acyltransferase n=1 Tax=Haloflavibacter putidus TaxID=2576776 RepID=A0A507ZPU0_9FLAO|nr:apolipoprotein N-acyltransferase [Haloflavibacter putidus]TQD38601.1 apolipoprotein N-acyltransferase [Haloflavibacter putidus]